MLRPKYRTRSQRGVSVTTPSGRPRIHFSEKRRKSSLCAICKRALSSVVRSSLSTQCKRLKTEKRPERIYGEIACSSCLKDLLKEAIRGVG